MKAVSGMVTISPARDVAAIPAHLGSLEVRGCSES